MNTKAILTASALLQGTLGIGLTFMPQDVGQLLGIEPTKSVLLLLQMQGGLLFGFAMLNWMAKGSAVGGIYNRPLVIANLSQFTVTGLALFKAVLSDPSLPPLWWAIAAINVVLGVCFGIIMNVHPGGQKQA